MSKSVKQGIHVSKTIGNVTFYQMDGRSYSRKKSSLTRKRVLKGSEFEMTRKYATNFGRASAIASPVYDALPPYSARGRMLFRIIAGEAASLLYAGKDEQEVKDFLWKKYIQEPDCENVMATCSNKPRSVEVKQMNRKLRAAFLARLLQECKPTRNLKRAWRNGEAFKPHLW